MGANSKSLKALLELIFISGPSDWIHAGGEKAKMLTKKKQELKITPEELMAELARMLGGIKITDKTRAYAREMLEDSQK